MKLSTKVAALILAGSLTTVFAADATNTQDSANANVNIGTENSAQVDASTNTIAMTKESIATQIKEIKAASNEQRVELMNQFKTQLQTQDIQTRQEAMNMYSKAMNINSQINTAQAGVGEMKLGVENKHTILNQNAAAAHDSIINQGNQGINHGINHANEGVNHGANVNANAQSQNTSFMGH